jgi:hypothetical protein
MCKHGDETIVRVKIPAKVATKRRTTKRPALPRRVGGHKVILHEGGQRMKIGCQDHDIDTWITDGRRALEAAEAATDDNRYGRSAYPCRDGSGCGAACRLYVYLRDGAIPMSSARKLLNVLERMRK